MGMSIENSIETLTSILDEATESEDSVCYVTSADAGSLKLAIDTMRKYQKIEDIVNNRVDKTSLEVLKSIMDELNIPSNNYTFNTSPPTYRQIRYAEDIAKGLNIDLPKEKSKSAYSYFISTYADKFKERTYFPSESDEWDLEDCVPHGY